MIKQHVDETIREAQGILPGVSQGLQPLFQALDDPKDGTPAEDLTDAIENFMSVATFFSDAQSLSQINNVLKGSLIGYAGFTPQDPVPNTFREYLDAVVENTEEQFRPLFVFLMQKI